MKLDGLIPAGLCEAVRSAFLEEVAPCEQALLRVLVSEPELHRWDADGRMLNPIAFPYRHTQFPRFSQTEQLLMRGSHLVPVARALLGGPVAMLQSAYWMSSEGTDPHLDVNPLDPGAPMLGVWIALEPVGPAAGRFFLFDRSHLVPEHDPDGALLRELGVQQWSARYAERDEPPQDARFEACLRRLVERYGWQALAPAMNTGDVVLWSEGAVHGSVAPSVGGGTRHSVLIHFVRDESNGSSA